MRYVKGNVLLSRFEYLENKKGAKVFREFLRKIGSDEANFVRQPVDGSSTYSEKLLSMIDEILLKDHFKNNLKEFESLGSWNAGNFMNRYFYIYMDEKKPLEFLQQYARLRQVLIGSGEMEVSPSSLNSVKITIEYGQNISKTVCLSEQGFIYGALKHCGASDINITELNCASEKDILACIFEIKYST